MKQDNVSHKGIITSVSSGSVTIRTDGSHSCDGCAVSMLCNKDGGEGKGETITVSVRDGARFTPGEHVEAVASSGSTLMAAVWALIVPTVLFLGVVFLCQALWPAMGSWSLGAGFAALAVYDLILYLLRKRFARRLTWTIRPVGGGSGDSSF